MAKKKSKETNAEKVSLYAVIRVRGPVNVRADVRDTLKMMRLGRVNHCVLVPSTPSYKGMLHKAEECITWGEISEQTLEKLIFKRGRVGKKGVRKDTASRMSKDVFSSGKLEEKVDPVFRLNPPSKGYKAIRRFYPKGALGYRGDKINELLKRMI